MSATENLLVYLVSIGVFVAVDSVWLGKIAPKLYRETIGHLMAKKPNFIAAAVFYAIFLVGLLVFAIRPALNEGDIYLAFGYGALYGLTTYATFDLTSQAVFKNWPTKITIVDMVWGSFLSFAVSATTYCIANRFIV